MNNLILTEEMLKNAVIKACHVEDELYGKDIEMEEHVFSRKYRLKMETLIRTEAKQKNTMRRSGKLRFRYILVAALISIMMATTVMAYEPLREKVFQIIEKLFSDHTDVTFEEIEGGAENGSEIQDEFVIFEPAYIPDGYELVDEGITEALKSHIYVYMNEKEKAFFFSQDLAGEFDVSFTSDGKSAKEIPINGRTAYWIQDDEGYNTVLYVYEEYVITIAGYDDVEILLDILAETFPEKK